MKSSRASTIIIAVATQITCGGGDSSGPDARQIEFDRDGLVANLVEAVIVPTYRQFERETEALSAAVTDYCAAIAGADAEPALAAAQDAWRAAMTTWQRAELMQVGPASGGERDLVYSWPIVSACAVDQDVVLLREDPDGYDISSRLPNRRGLDALEYALFVTDTETACPPQAVPAGWESLADAERVAARCAFARVAAAELATRASALVAAVAGDGLSEPDAVTAAFHALFYLDSATKDGKLAAPAGLRENSCGAVGTVCAADLESLYARHSRDNVRANLVGFGEMFTGADGPGFDDFLIAADAGELADRIVADLDAALLLVDAIEGSLVDLLASDPGAVEQPHAAIRAVTDQLKGEVPSTLGLTIPDEVGGDAD